MTSHILSHMQTHITHTDTPIYSHTFTCTHTTHTCILISCQVFWMLNISVVYSTHETLTIYGRYFQMSICVACFVDITTFGCSKRFSTAPSLWGGVNQLFLIISSHQGRVMGKQGQWTCSPWEKIDFRKLTQRTWGWTGLCQVAAPAPALRRSHLSKGRSHSPASSQSAYLPSFS